MEWTEPERIRYKTYHSYYYLIKSLITGHYTHTHSWSCRPRRHFLNAIDGSTLYSHPHIVIEDGREGAN